MESFKELSLPDFLGKSLQQMNFTKPTPVQAQAIPLALEGKDVIASAQTGTGKTAAFGIPLLSYLENNREKTALVLTPTRELAMQVLDVLRKLTGAHALGGSALLIGGANMGAQLTALSRKPRLVIGTPGRVIDHLNRGSLSLGSTGFLVLDEADRMLDMGFAPQLEAIRKRLAGERQTLLFSATIPPDIQTMAANYLKAPVRVTVGSTTQPVPQISQKVLHTTEAKKPEELLSELQERRGSVLVFARTQHRVDRILNRLKEKGIKATRIHGGRTQSQRRQAIDQFREGHYLVLVATDIAARGLDIHHIAHVINYDLPRNPEDYIHRVGRTARAGAEGEALCFLTPEDGDLWRRILKLIGANPQSIPVKPSRFGFTAPKPQPAQPRPHHPARPHPKTAHPRHESRPHDESQGPHSHRPQENRQQGHHRDDFRRRDFQRPSSGRRYQRSGEQDQGAGFHSKPAHPRHGSRHEASGFAKASPDRSTQGGRHQGHQGHRDRFSRRDNFIFHGSEDRQPGQHERENTQPRQENFLQKLGRKLTGAQPHRAHEDSFRDRQDRHQHRPFDDRREEQRSGGFGSGDRHRHPRKHFRPKGRFNPHP